MYIADNVMLVAEQKFRNPISERLKYRIYGDREDIVPVLSFKRII